MEVNTISDALLAALDEANYNEIIVFNCKGVGLPLPFIMQLLGYESISTTSGFYAFETLEMMGEAMNNIAPTFKNEDKIWKREDIKKVIYSLD